MSERDGEAGGELVADRSSGEKKKSSKTRRRSRSDTGDADGPAKKGDVVEDRDGAPREKKGKESSGKNSKSDIGKSSRENKDKSKDYNDKASKKSRRDSGGKGEGRGGGSKEKSKWNRKDTRSADIPIAAGEDKKDNTHPKRESVKADYAEQRSRGDTVAQPPPSLLSSDKATHSSPRKPRTAKNHDDDEKEASTSPSSSSGAVSTRIGETANEIATRELPEQPVKPNSSGKKKQSRSRSSNSATSSAVRHSNSFDDTERHSEAGSTPTELAMPSIASTSNATSQPAGGVENRASDPGFTAADASGRIVTNDAVNDEDGKRGRNRHLGANDYDMEREGAGLAATVSLSAHRRTESSGSESPERTEKDGSVLVDVRLAEHAATRSAAPIGGEEWKSGNRRTVPGEAQEHLTTFDCRRGSATEINERVYEDTSESKPSRRGSGAKGRALRRSSSGGNGELQIDEERSARSPPELGVQVIHRGATKQLIITTAGAGAAALKPKGMQRPSPAATCFNRGMQQPAAIAATGHRDHTTESRRTCDIIDEVERSEAFREKFSAAVLAEVIKMSPGSSSKGTAKQISLSSSPPPANEGFTQRDGHNLWEVSPVSSTVSSGRPGYGNERTAAYVQQQESFHEALRTGNDVRKASPMSQGGSGSYGLDAPPHHRSRPLANHPDDNVNRNSLRKKTGGSLSAAAGSPMPNAEERTAGGGGRAKNQPTSREDVSVRDDALTDVTRETTRHPSPSHGASMEGCHTGEGRERVSGCEDHEAYNGACPCLQFRSEFSRQLVEGERPAMFFLRPNEGLAVMRVLGMGRLLVTLREEAGDAVLVENAVVHDSAAHFDQSAISIDHRFPYVEGHRYEFYTASTQDFVLPSRSSIGEQRRAIAHEKFPVNKMALQVCFSVVSVYKPDERVRTGDAMRLCPPPLATPTSARSTLVPTKPMPDRATSSPILGSPRSPPPRAQASRSGYALGTNSAHSHNLAVALVAPCLAEASGAANRGVTADGSKTFLRATSVPVPAASSRGLRESTLPHGPGLGSGVAMTRGTGAHESGYEGPPLPLRDGYENQPMNGETRDPGSEVAVDTSPHTKDRVQRASFLQTGGETVLRTSNGHAGGISAHASDGHYASLTGIDRTPNAVQNALRSGLPTYAAGVSYPPRDRDERDRERQTAQLRWNPAWEGHNSSARAIHPSFHSLPLIRRHVDASPRSAFDEREGHWSPHDRIAGLCGRRSYAHAINPVEGRRQEFGITDNIYRRPVVRKGSTYAESQLAVQHSATPPYERGSGVRGASGFGQDAVATGNRIPSQQGNLLWHNEPNGCRPSLNRTAVPPAQNGGDVPSIVDDPSGRWRRRQDENWKRDGMVGTRMGVPHGTLVGDDARRRSVDMANLQNARYKQSFGGVPASEYESTYDAHSKGLRFGPRALRVPRAVPMDSEARYSGADEKNVYHQEDRHRYNALASHVTVEMPGERSLDGEEIRYNSTRVEPDRKRVAREQSAYVRPRRNRQNSGKSSGRIGNISNHTGIGQAPPPRWVKF